jgi:phage shock protein C
MDINDLSGGDPPRPLRRLREGRVLSGTAAGLARYLDVDVAAVRIAFVALAVLGGIGIPAYVACWLLIPEEDTETTLVDDLLGHVGDVMAEAEDHLHRGRYL